VFRTLACRAPATAAAVAAAAAFAVADAAAMAAGAGAAAAAAIPPPCLISDLHAHLVVFSEVALALFRRPL